MPPATSEILGRVVKCNGGEQRSVLNVSRRVYGGLCISILGGILFASLWPFRAPINEVEWLPGENGLQFGNRGIVTSAKAFHTASPRGPCSLEVSLQLDRISGSGTILAFDDSVDPKEAFALRQFGDGLAMQRPEVDARGNMVRLWWKTDNVFDKEKREILTITSAQGKTVLYVNGIPANASTQFGLVSEDLTGRLVLGGSAVRDNWPGRVTGLAIYDVALTPSQVEEHFVRWTREDRPIVDGEKHPMALYLFDEQRGSIVRDRMNGGYDLAIPARYFLLHPPFLEPVWAPYRSQWDGWMTRSYWSDVLLNVAGFVPLGFFLTAYLSRVGLLASTRMTTILLGLAISLTIEIAQYFLPTRNSSMTDLLTNTIGTAVGATLYKPALLTQKIRVTPS
jgi:hypothetical protein